MAATAAATETNGKPGQDAGSVVTLLEKTLETQQKVSDRLEALEKSVSDAKATRYPHGVPGGAPNIRKGENIMSSRPYSLTRLAVALAKQKDGTPDWDKHAKQELELSAELRKAYQTMGYSGSGVMVPLGSDLMPTVERELADGTKVPGIDAELVQKCADMMGSSMSGFDADEYTYLVRKGLFNLRKDLSAQTGTVGGTLVGLATQGELIEYLRGVEIFSQVGAMQIDLPPQGRIRFPRQTGSVTIYSTSEGATITESTPATSGLELTAKAYTGLVDIPDELIKFSTSVAVEAWLRTEFLRELALKADRDQLYGNGGQAIQGIVNYSGVQLLTATTVGTNGDTLGAADPTRLFSAIADQNAPIDKGFFFAMTNTLWGGLSTRRADAITAGDGAGPFVFNTFTAPVFNGGLMNRQLNGLPVVCSTQVPTNRAKGSGTTLTLLLGGVGAEWVIARAGVAEITMTNSDASKFQQRIQTMRGTVFMDAGPRHENSFGYIDTLVNG